MRDDTPAALPLFALVCGLTYGHWGNRPTFDALLVAACAALSFTLKRHPVALRAAAALAFTALGIALVGHTSAREAEELRQLGKLDQEAFVTVEMPIEQSWSLRGGTWRMQSQRFRVNDVAIAQPLAMYARFVPPSEGNAVSVRARGFLRRSDRGTFSLSIKSEQLLSYRGVLPWWSPGRWNRALARRIEPLAPGYPDEVAIVEAVALGRNERLTDDVRSSFRRGGTYHLLVFSGLQIAAAAAFLAWLLRWMHAPRASDWLLAAFAAAGPLFIGPTASVSRASVAIGLYAASRILGRPTSLTNLWCVAAIVRLVFVPADLLSPAFQLTYAGAGAILFIARRRPLLPVVAETAITPLTLFHFHQYALGGSLATLVMTPLVFAMLVVSAIVFIWPAAIPLITLLHACCVRLNAAGAWTSGFHAAPLVSAMVLGYGGALAALAFLRGRWRPVAVMTLFLIPSLTTFRNLEPRSTELTMLDIGQGDSILFRGGGRTMLVDGGGRSDAPDFGESTLLPLLADRGVTRLDAVFLTHAHPDHCGGLPAVLERLSVRELWINPRRFRGECAWRLLEAASESETPIRLVKDGDRFLAGAFQARAFVAGGTFRKSSENNSSTVLEVQAEHRRILLTGDIERDAEGRLAGRLRTCDVLKVAHHGSHTSSTEPLLEAVSPRIALISVGRHNLFGHPHQEVLDALRGRGIRTYRTDRDGSVTLLFAGGHVFPSVECDP